MLAEVYDVLNHRDFDTARSEFTGGTRKTVDDEETFASLVEWILHDYVPEGKSRTVLEEILRNKGHRFSPRDRAFLEERAKARTSVFEVSALPKAPG